MAKLVTLENDGTKGILDSSSIGGGGGLSSITGTLNVDFGIENDTIITTIANTSIFDTTIKTFTYIPQETTDTSLDDFNLNGITVNIENIINNVSFDIRMSALNNASGVYQIKYIINY